MTRISDLIKALQRIEKLHGDVIVRTNNGDLYDIKPSEFGLFWTEVVYQTTYSDDIVEKCVIILPFDYYFVDCSHGVSSSKLLARVKEF